MPSRSRRYTASGSGLRHNQLLHSDLATLVVVAMQALMYLLSVFVPAHIRDTEDEIRLYRRFNSALLCALVLLSLLFSIVSSGWEDLTGRLLRGLMVMYCFLLPVMSWVCGRWYAS